MAQMKRTRPNWPMEERWVKSTEQVPVFSAAPREVRFASEHHRVLHSALQAGQQVGSAVVHVLLLPRCIAG